MNIDLGGWGGGAGRAWEGAPGGHGSGKGGVMGWGGHGRAGEGAPGGMDLGRLGWGLGRACEGQGGGATRGFLGGCRAVKSEDM